MVDLYADLVEFGLRALEPNEQGITLVPNLPGLRASVRAELDRRSQLQ